MYSDVKKVRNQNDLREIWGLTVVWVFVAVDPMALRTDISSNSLVVGSSFSAAVLNAAGDMVAYAKICVTVCKLMDKGVPVVCESSNDNVGRKTVSIWGPK